MPISREEIEKVSLLSRLILSEAELAAMTEQLGRILDYIQLLSEVDTADVEPLAHALEMHNVFRPDQLGQSLDREQALANAPNRDRECYLVPAVLGEI